MTFQEWLTHEPLAIKLESRSPGTDVINPLSPKFTHLCSTPVPTVLSALTLSK